MQTIEVSSPYGRLVGRRTPAGAAFLGVRYAEPPLGVRRFLPPQPIARAEGPVDATAPGPAPVQLVPPRAVWAMAPFVGGVSEDCLNLNVWTPAPDNARRPVLVHVFGGGFQTGGAFGGVQDAEALSTRGDIVVVRVNFRIGALGFLYLGDAWGEPYQAGSVGLLDLVAALAWVNANIGALGGDPDNVTVIGLSSGAFMAAALFGMPRTQGLFRRAVMQSGSASRIIARSAATAQTEAFLGLVGVRRGDRAALEALPVERILAAQAKIVARDIGVRNAPGGRTLGIVDDGVTLAEHPFAVLRRGDRRDASIVLGSTLDETRLWTARGDAVAVASEREILAEIIRFAGERHAPRLFAAYRAAFADASLETLRDRFLSDAIYILPAWRTATAHAAAGGQAWLYQFAWTPPFEGGRLGAAHSFDEPFLWGAADPARAPFVVGAEAEAARLAAEMSTSLLGFVAGGDPGWPSVAPREPRARVFGADAHGFVGPSPLFQAWEGVERR